MYCKASVNNGSVVIYYGTGGIMRFPTGVNISKRKDKKNLFVEWDYKKNLIREEVKNAATMNKVILDWVKKADEVVSEQLLLGVKITAPELKAELTAIRDGKVKKLTEYVIDNLEIYLEQKNAELVGRENKSDESFKTYGTFENTIKDYEAEKGVKLKVRDIATRDWLNEFHTWLGKERPKEVMTANGVHKFKSRGKLKSASIDKRFEVLTGFVSFLKEKGLVSDDSFLRNYKRSEIIVVPKIKTTLSVSEIHALYNHKFSDEAKERVKLAFLFACMTGFRWQDLAKFDKRFIKELKGRKVYQHIATKTKKSGKVATIPLADFAIRILEELNYNLSEYSNAYSNRLLHELLEESEMFNDITLSKDETGRFQARHELITMHRGRDTFISNLINVVPLHELMSYTSHEKLSTLQTYIDSSREINPDYVNIFDRP